MTLSSINRNKQEKNNKTSVHTKSLHLNTMYAQLLMSSFFKPLIITFSKTKLLLPRKALVLKHSLPKAPEEIWNNKKKTKKENTTQRTHIVVKTSMERWFNILTLDQRWFDVVSTLCACWVHLAAIRLGEAFKQHIFQRPRNNRLTITR